ncbi:hypothetical protein GOBAR_DD18971 [Gossypium barbadense]|nr:hypothetical protein GOBAR_DD18971 [Gossypium barbadense]
MVSAKVDSEADILSNLNINAGDWPSNLVKNLCLLSPDQGAPLTEYTLRLIGSDIEHYIRKLLYDGEIKYNMDAKVLNFSMGKPRILFNNSNDGQFQDG